MTEELNNHLAEQRTLLANERTLLAYVRTALTMFIAGVSFIEFFQMKIFEVLGVVFIIAGVLLTLVGSYKFRKINLYINKAKE